MSELEIAAARARAEAARNRLGNALAALKHRLLPATIARNVAHGLAEKGRDAAEAGADAVKARPALAVGAGALAALFLARKPLSRALANDLETLGDAARSAADSDTRKADQ